MRYLFDTNTLSETVKPVPNASVVAWLDGLNYDKCFVSVLTLGEIRKGVERLAPSARRERFKQWLEVALPNRFGNNVLHVDLEIADRWGRLTVEQARTPRPIVDSLLAATALTHGLTLVTCDTDLIGIPGLEIFNPWAMN